MKVYAPLALFLVTTISTAALAAPGTTLEGGPARDLFTALRQADLAPRDSLGPDPVHHGQKQLVDQKVLVTNLRCALAYDSLGTLLGTCTGRDASGQAVRLGSAAAGNLLTAMPEAFQRESSPGHFEISAARVECDFDLRQNDETGLGTARCLLQ